jgi:thermostable 8-oxoguanine DNA glycosylase
MDVNNVARLVKSVTRSDVTSYIAYLNSIRPETNTELFKRWLFAFASVHTTWEMNCKLYLALSQSLHWVGDDGELKRILIECRAGLHNNRASYISEFARKFWADPSWYWKKDDETWMGFRDRICKAVRGIGRAKSSFVVEMMYPEHAKVVCTDTHVMQAYGRTPEQVNHVSDKDEALMESIFVGLCEVADVPPVVARYRFWDRKQGHSNSRYWTRVFEQPKLLTAAPLDMRKVAEALIEIQEIRDGIPGDEPRAEADIG